MRLVDWLIVRELLPPLLFGVGLFITLIFASLHDSFWANRK
jgi:lipopolysaccharide export LptBFGC system permease protein LptF